MKAPTPLMSSVSKVPLFVYGTLMSPVVMESLIQRRVQGQAVRLLPSSYIPPLTDVTVPISNEERRYDYSRHPVRSAVYPGLVHWNTSNIDETMNLTKNYVCGLLYNNLTESEMKQLDEFEGDQYTKELCYVQRQPNNSNIDELMYSKDDVVQAMVYVWSYPLSDLDLSKDWSYATFEEKHLATYL